MKWLVNQDKNCIVFFDELKFDIIYKYYNNIEIACNLYYKNILLGSFLNIEECILEIFKIVYKQVKVYKITNYT